jgi:hypothetical protein
LLKPRQGGEGWHKGERCVRAEREKALSSNKGGHLKSIPRRIYEEFQRSLEGGNGGGGSIKRPHLWKAREVIQKTIIKKAILLCWCKGI